MINLITKIEYFTFLSVGWNSSIGAKWYWIHFI